MDCSELDHQGFRCLSRPQRHALTEEFVSQNADKVGEICADHGDKTVVLTTDFQVVGAYDGEDHMEQARGAVEAYGEKATRPALIVPKALRA